MVIRTRKRLYSSILLITVPAALTLTAVPALAGDLVTDPAADFDCDGERDAVDGDEHGTVDGRFAAGSVTVKYSGGGEQVTIDQATEGVNGAPEEGDNFGQAFAAHDETGDGCDDLVVGAPYEDVSGDVNAGMVWIIPGSESGLDPAASTSFHADSPGIPGATETDGYFGRTLAAGETFGDDPYLIIGADGAQSAAGAVYYRYQGATKILTQDSPGVSGAAEADDRFGFRVSVSNDLVAVSAFREQVGEAAGAGMAHVFAFNAEGGLEQLVSYHQNTTGISGTAETDDYFGLSLSVIAYQPTSDGPIVPLLSVGAPGEDLKSNETGTDAGLTHLIRADSPTSHTQIAALDQDSPGVPGEVEGSDGFGHDTVLAVRDAGTIGTPATTSWVIAAQEYNAPLEWNYYDATVFGVTDDPAADAVLVKGDSFGLPLHEYGSLDSLNASADYLYFGSYVGVDAVYGVPWGNILDGGTDPTVVHKVDQ